MESVDATKSGTFIASGRYDNGERICERMNRGLSPTCSSVSPTDGVLLVETFLMLISL